MRRLTLHLGVALLTFAAGATVVLLFSRHPPADKTSDSRRDETAAGVKENPPAPTNECGRKDEIAKHLPQLYEEYEQIEKQPAVKQLVDLDGRLRKLIENVPEYYPCDDGKIWETKYLKLDVAPGYWSILEYGGGLLVKAHQMNPRSKHRAYTLFSTVGNLHGLGTMPNIKAAHQYAKEFPEGPFIKETLLIIADFYKDLFIVLRDDLRDYKYKCFKPYIGRHSRSNQLKQAKATAISYYQKALAIASSNTRLQETLNEVSNGTIQAWSYCAD